VDAASGRREESNAAKTMLELRAQEESRLERMTNLDTEYSSLMLIRKSNLQKEKQKKQENKE
jgi:hypothetical protein